MPPKKDPKAQELPKEPDPEPKLHELNGYSRFQYLTGALYQGNWTIVKGKKVKHGYGKLTFSQNITQTQTYEGNWDNDQMEGYGVYRYPDGSTYSGEWQSNQHNGQGIFEFPDGTTYKGEWKNHLMEGQGEYTDLLGRKWTGQYRQGIFQSRCQSNLSSLIRRNEQNQNLKESVKGFIDKLIELLRSKRQNFQIVSFFQKNRQTQNLVASMPVDFFFKTREEWASAFERLKNGTITVLENPKDSKVLLQQSIYSEQLQGQLVELNSKDGEGCAFLSQESGNWMVLSYKG